jgi:hypothetical protein
MRTQRTSVTALTQTTQVLSPSAAAWPTRLSRLVILSALVSASVSPMPTSAHAAAGTTISWGWPVAPPHPIERPFIAPDSAYGPGHRGIDISSTDGTAVIAPADGVVSFAGMVINRPVLAIQHADGLVSSYEPVESDLLRGTRIQRLPAFRGAALRAIRVTTQLPRRHPTIRAPSDPAAAAATLMSANGGYRWNNDQPT